MSVAGVGGAPLRVCFDELAVKVRRAKIEPPGCGLTDRPLPRSPALKEQTPEALKVLSKEA